MSSRFSECKQGWMSQFSGLACALWWSLTEMCAKFFTPALFIAKIRKALQKGDIMAFWREAEIATISLHFPPWWPQLFWMAFWLPETFAAKPIFTPGFKTCSNFSSSWERHKHQRVSFLSRNIQCQRMKNQILYSQLRLISVIRKENPLGIETEVAWTQNQSSIAWKNWTAWYNSRGFQTLVWTSPSGVRRKAHWKQLLQLALQAAEL